MSTPEELWELADEHDFVVIAAPNDAHVPLAERALDAGLAVVVDKPLAPSAEEAAALVEHARASGKLLTVFHNRRWDSDHRTLRKLLAEGALGDVLRYESRFERWRPEPRADAWRETAGPGRAAASCSISAAHLVDQALQLFGPVSHVYAEIDNRRGVARRRRRLPGAATPLRHLQPPVDVVARRRSRAAPARARIARRLRRRGGRRTGGRAARRAGARTIPTRGASSRSRAGAGS